MYISANQPIVVNISENKTTIKVLNNHNQVVPEADKTLAEAHAVRLLPQQETPVPKTKMKTINWNKIPESKVRTPSCILNYMYIFTIFLHRS